MHTFQRSWYNHLRRLAPDIFMPDVLWFMINPGRGSRLLRREYNYCVQSSPKFGSLCGCRRSHGCAGLPQPLTYGVPEHLSVKVGDTVLVSCYTSRVRVCFSHEYRCLRSTLRHHQTHRRFGEGAAAFDEQLRDLALYVQEATLCELIDAVRLIAPDVLTSKIATQIDLNPDWEERMEGSRPNFRAARIIDALRTASGPWS